MYAYNSYNSKITEAEKQIESMVESEELKEEEILQLESDIKSTSEKLSEKEDDIFNLNSSMEKMQGEIEVLEEDNNKFKDENKELKSEIETLKKNRVTVSKKDTGTDSVTIASKSANVDTKKETRVDTVEDKPSESQNSINVSATAYTSECEGCSGITYTGHDVNNTTHENGMRVVAVDPNVIPLGSIVKVDSETMSFTGIASDIGGAIKGNRIDILVGSDSKANNFGVQDAEVTVIREGGN